MKEYTLNTLLCAEYEEILTGKRTQLSNSLLKKYSNSKYYVPMMRYVFEEMLGWSPEDVRLYISMDVIRALKLEMIINMVDIPNVVNLEEDTGYLAHLLYPERYPFDYTTAVLTEYKRRTEGGGDGNLKKGFFDDEKGRIAARICLRYAIEHHLQVVSSDRIYEFFADTEKATDFILEHKLKNALQLHYESCLEYLHDSLLPPMRCELYYWFHVFKNQFDDDRNKYLIEIVERRIEREKRVKERAADLKRKKARIEQRRSRNKSKTGSGADTNMPRKD